MHMHMRMQCTRSSDVCRDPDAWVSSALNELAAREACAGLEMGLRLLARWWGEVVECVVSLL